MNTLRRDLAARYLAAASRAADPRIARLARDVSVAAGEQCPECDSRSTESNGGTEYRCCGCDHRWGVDGERYGY